MTRIGGNPEGRGTSNRLSERIVILRNQLGARRVPLGSDQRVLHSTIWARGMRKDTDYGAQITRHKTATTDTDIKPGASLCC